MKTHRPVFLNCAAVLLCAGLALRVPAQKSAELHSAITKLEAAVKRNPFDVRLRIQLGLAYWDQNDSTRALREFQEAVKIGPSSAEAHNWLGVALMGKADLPGAVAELRKAVAFNPKYARAFTNLGSALAKSGDLSGAVEAFQKALALEPGSMRAQMNLGVALREKGDADGALTHLRRVAEAEPADANVQYELGQTLRQSGDLAAGVKAFERSVEIDPELQESYYGLGQTLKQQAAAAPKHIPGAASPADEFCRRAQEAVVKGDWNAARQQLTQALQADDTNAEAHNLLGYVEGQQGNLDFAVRHLQRAVGLRPDYGDAHYNLGVALWYSGSKEKAVSELRESVRLDPAAGPSYAFLGMALREAGDFSAARASLQRAIALLPPTTATYIDLGIVFLHSGNLDQALAQFEAGLNGPPPSVPTPDWDAAVAGLREALTKNPGRADVHNMLGLLLGRKGESSSDVLAEFQEAVRLRPEYAQAHNNIGLVLAQSDDDEKAIAEFREAVRIRPDYADAHANLGATLMPADNEGAIVELEKAVALNPMSAKAQFNLAEAYGTSPSHGPAQQIEQLRKVIALAPAFPRAHLALGKALLQSSKVQEAVGELRQAVQLDPQSGESHYQLGLALARVGKREEGAAEAQKGREFSAADERRQNADLDVSEGRVALSKGDLEQAIAQFQHALKVQPDSASAQHFLGVAFEKQGDLAGASKAYRQALILDPGDTSAKRALERLELPNQPTSPVTPGNGGGDDSAQVSNLESYIRQSRFQEVEPLLAKYVRDNPKSDWGWYALGYSQFAQKEIGDSIKSLAKCLQLNINNAEAHKILGRDLMIIGRFDAAQKEFEQGIRNAPSSAEMHYDLGKLFSMQDNWQDALNELEAAVGLNSSYVEATDALGFAQEALGKDTAAVASYQKAIALNEARRGDFVAPYVNLSAFYNRTGDAAKALELAQKGLALNPKSDAAWFQKSRAEDRQGQLEQAVDSLNRAIALNNHSSSYYYVLAGLYRRLGKSAESRKALESFTRLDRENNDLEKMRRHMAMPNAERPGGGRE